MATFSKIILGFSCVEIYYMVMLLAKPVNLCSSPASFICFYEKISMIINKISVIPYLPVILVG